ncbi:hypothetical protein NECID01_0511 [Nematocida sp. AWRm77]|nr:hypothetical protein NECID01_0511 [Nematocida sp. AWRm77]
MSTDNSESMPWKYLLFRKTKQQIKAGKISKLRRTLEKYGIDPGSFEDGKGRSLLHVSTVYGKTKISKYLMESGCSQHKQDAGSVCPVYLAALHKRHAHLELFSIYGAAYK